MNRKSIKAIVLAAVLLLTQFMFGNVMAQDDIVTATIAATEEGLVVPETIPAGWVEITFENTSEIPLFSIIGRLDDGATIDEFMEALMGMMGGDASILPPATFIGSPTTMPDATQTALYQLQAGTYVLLSVAGEEPDIATFMVEGEMDETDYEPEADMTIPLADFAFGLPTELVAGEQTWLIENVGEQWHEMVFIPVPDGTTLEEAMPMLMGMEGEDEETADESQDAGMPQFEFVWSPMSAEEQAWVRVDLAPGTYLVSCFIEDVNSEDAVIHAELGMIQIVTVTESDN